MRGFDPRFVSSQEQAQWVFTVRGDFLMKRLCLDGATRMRWKRLVFCPTGFMAASCASAHSPRPALLLPELG